MAASGAVRLILYLLPGLLLGAALIGGALLLQPPGYQVPALAAEWTEPKVPAGRYRSWRPAEGGIIGESQPFPANHPRAHCFLLGRTVYQGDVEVTLDVRFERGRELACYLCYDPVAETGYRLATGVTIPNESAQEATIEIRRGEQSALLAHAPLPLVAGQDYAFSFRRQGDVIWLAINGKPIATANDANFHQGHIQLELHQSKVHLRSLTVRAGAPGP